MIRDLPVQGAACEVQRYFKKHFSQPFAALLWYNYPKKGTL